MLFIIVVAAFKNRSFRVRNFDKAAWNRLAITTGSSWIPFLDWDFGPVTAWRDTRNSVDMRVFMRVPPEYEKVEFYIGDVCYTGLPIMNPGDTTRLFCFLCSVRASLRRIVRTELSPEELRELRERDAERKRARRAKMTREELRNKRERVKVRKAEKRLLARMTPEEKVKYRQRKAQEERFSSESALEVVLNLFML